MRDLLIKIEEHDKWRGLDCINLIPSENLTSPSVQRILASDMSRRYSLQINQKIHGSLVKNAYRGTRYMDEIEAMGERIACRIYNAKYASLKPISGHVAALIALLSTCKRGDLMMTIDSRHGGYDGYMSAYMPSFLGLRVGFLPFEPKTWNLDIDECCDAISSRRPKVVVVGSSFILFPYELRKLKMACRKARALLLYDASHVFGLMPRNFQDPLGDGVDLLFGSTHKSFFGPQGGLILTNHKRIFDRVNKSMTWKTLDNAHWNRIAALTQALLEYERFGKDYGMQVVNNAKAFALALDNLDIPVRFSNLGYTKSHMLLLDDRKLRSRHKLSLNEFAIRLERSNIIVDAVGRLGSNEITRLGAEEAHIVKLAELIKGAVKRNVRVDVTKLRRTLNLNFCI